MPSCIIFTWRLDGVPRGGRLLVEAVGAWAMNEGCHWMVVGTDPANTKAHAFYRKMGFDPVETETQRFGRTLEAR